MFYQRVLNYLESKYTYEPIENQRISAQFDPSIKIRFSHRVSKDTLESIQVISRDNNSVLVSFSSNKLIMYQLDLRTGEYFPTITSRTTITEETDKIMEDIRYFGNNSIHFINNL